MERRKFVIGLGALATGSAAAVGSGAFSAAQIDDRDVSIAVADDSEALIALEEGGSEFVGREEGQLYIDFTSDEGGEGVNPNSTYQVGAVGDDGEDALETWAADSTADPAVDSSNLLYGEAADDSSDDTAEDEHAFKVTNNTGTNHDLELFYEGAVADNSTVVMIAEGNDIGSAAFEVHPDTDDDGGRIAALPLGGGTAIYVSILVVTGEGEDITDEEFDGELVLQAGEAEGEYDI